MSQPPSSVDARLLQCDLRIAATRALIDALNREAALRAQMLHNERHRMIGHLHVPQADWIAMIETDQTVQQQQSRDAQSELIHLLTLRAALLVEQAAAAASSAAKQQ